MKKINIAILVLLMALSLGGCGSKDKETEKVVMYFVRHGKTMFNTTGQVQGWADTPLTEKGEEQAKATGVGLKDIEFKSAYSSDLGRARATAKLILNGNKNKVPELEELIGLREWGYGGYEGKSDSEMWTPLFEAHGLKLDEEWSQYPKLTEVMSDEDIANTIAKNDPTHTAENYDQIKERSLAAIDQIINETKNQGGGNALVVSSGGEIPTILELIVPGQYQGEVMDNCSVTIVEYENGKYTLKSIGDTSFTEKGIIASNH